MFFLIKKKDPATNWKILSMELKVIGFLGWTFKKDWPQAFDEMHKYMKEVYLWYFFFKKIKKFLKFKPLQKGRLKTQETTYNGFDKMRDAFYGLLKGENTGKAVVKA